MLLEIMLKKAISRVLIADNDNNLLGIVTRTDLINSITNLSLIPYYYSIIIFLQGI